MINQNILAIASKLDKLNKDFSNNKCRIIDNKVYDSKFLFFHFFYWSSEFYNSPYRKILIDYFEKAEKHYPGSSHMLSVKLCQKIYGINDKEEKVKAISKKYADVMFHLKSLTEKNAFRLFEDLITFSGADATIRCVKSKNQKIEVVKSCVPEFKIQLINDFRQIYFTNIKETTKDFLVSIIDGFIERESEIFSLIEHAKKCSLPVILITRGMSDYAKKNLKYILLKNNIMIYPYIEPYNNEDPFKLNDISLTIGNKIISADQGDNINNNIIDKSSICKCTISTSSIKIHRKNKILVNQIKKQIEENKNNTDLMPYLIKRKLRCLPNNTTVKIPEAKIKMLNEIKNLIKCFNSCAINGVYTDTEIIKSVKSEKITDTLSKNLYNNLISISYLIKKEK